MLQSSVLAMLNVPYNLTPKILPGMQAVWPGLADELQVLSALEAPVVPT